jgi:RES domain-containing protein
LFVIVVLTIWRLEKERYVETAFRGKGSLETSGRWHHKGTQVAYASEHPGVAVLEKLVWLGSYERARESSYVLLPLELDPTRHLETVSESDLPDDWDAFPHPEETRNLGTDWCEEERSAVLAVPSAVLPMSTNYLVNPFHPEFHDLERGEPVSFSWDARLFQRMQE